MLLVSAVDIFSNSGVAQANLATYPSWTSKSYIVPPQDDPDYMVVTFELSGTTPTAMYAKIDFQNAYDASPDRGPFPSMTYSAGIVTWDDTVHKLQLTANEHMLMQPMLAGYKYRMSVGISGGDATTAILAKADLHRRS